MKHNYFNPKTQNFLAPKKQSYGFILMIMMLFFGSFLTAQTAGPNLPATGATQGGAGNAWTTPTRIQANDGLYATVLMNPGEFSEPIRGTNYGFAIPAGSSITGIGVTIRRRSDANGGGNSINDRTLQLVKAGTPVGSNLAVATDWPITAANATYGGPGNLWGTTWTVADINAGNFGVNLAVETQATSSDRTASVDYIQVTVYYAPSTPTITSFTPANVCDNANASIIITGTNFTGATSVKINGVNVAYTVNSATQITATYPSGGTGGAISVQTPSGTATSATNLVVNTMPTVAAIGGNTSVCRFGTTTLTNATGGGTWSSATPAVATINSASGLVTGVTAGTSVITYTVTSGACTNTATMTMTVNGLPVLSGPSAVCVGNTIQLSPSVGGTWTSSNSNASIDNTGLVTGLLQGNVTFTYTNTATGCSNTTASVAVNASPAIISQSGTLSVCSGNSASFSVSATGTGLSYQWYNGATMLSNTGNISGATSNSLVINPVALADASADYHCIISGTCAPAATSTSVALNVTEKVVITGQPIVSQSLCSGNTATFSVNATGTGLTYQWFNGAVLLVDGINISGATSATLTLNNLVVGDASTTYHCTVTGTSPCNPVTSNNATLIVNQGPGIVTQPAATQTVCSGASVSISVTASGGSLSYQWYRNGSPIANGGNISGATSPTLVINPASPSDSATDYYCVASNGCVIPAASANSELVVNEKPYIFSYTATACSEDAFLVSPVGGSPAVTTIVPSGTTYSWPAPVVTGGLTGGSAQTGQPVISQTLLNPTNTAQTATYTVTPVSGTSGACVGANFTVVVTVNPKPFIINSSASVCSGENLTITPTNGGGNIVPAGTTYSWSAPVVTGGITGGSAGSGTSFNIMLTNPTNTVQTASYNVSAMSGTCMGSVFSIAVDVNPKPTVAANLATQTICSGSAIAPITMSNPNNVGGTIDYNWTRNNNGPLTGMPAAGNGSVITGNLTNTTNTQQTATFTLTATSDQSCISTPITVTVVVDPIPTVTATPATQTICSGNAIAPINFSNPNGIAGTVVYTWTRTNDTLLTGIPANGAGTNITGNLTNTTSVQQSTVFTILATVNGCGTNTTTVTVIVNPRPDVAAAPATQTLCSGFAITPISITNPNALPGTTFGWTRDNTANVTGPLSGSGNSISGTWSTTSNVDQPVIFTITATNAGCPSTATTSQVIVKAVPIMSVTPLTQSVCTGLPMTPIVFTNTNSLPGTTFSWTRTNTTGVTGIPDNDTTTTISGTPVNVTTTNQTTIITMTATAPNGCSTTKTATLIVNPVMTTPGIQESQVVCAGSRPTTFFITTPVTGGSGAYTYVWESSTTSDTGPWAPIAGATAATYQPPVTSGATPNTWYHVIITSCGSDVTSNAVSVVVANNSNFSFSIDFGTGTFCAGSSFNPRIFSFHGSSAYIRYSWIANPAYISPATGGPGGNTGCIFGLCLSDYTLPLTTINNTNGNITTTISITPMIYESDGTFICSLSPQTSTITIRPNPTATIVSPPAGTTICSATSASVSVIGNLTSDTMYYTVTRSTNASVTSSVTFPYTSPVIAIGGTFVFPDVLTNISAANQNVTYTFTPRSSNGNCNGTPVSITITVARPVTSGTIGTSHSVCFGGDPSLLTEITPANGTPVLTYQWYSAPALAGPWNPISGATATTYDPPAGLTTTTLYRREVTSVVNGVSCSIATSTPVTVSVNLVNVGTLSANQTLCSGGDPAPITIGTAATGSGTLSYLWESSITPTCVGPWTSVATTATFDPGPITQTTYYRRRVRSTIGAQFCEDYNACVIVYVNQVTGGTIGSDETLCGNNPSLIVELTASTGSGTLSYQWQYNTTSCGAAPAAWNNIPSATSANYDPPAGVIVTTYYRRVTTSTFNSVTCIAYSNCTTVTPNGVSPGSIGPNSTSVCAGGDPAAFTELAAGSGTGLTYQWQISTAGGSGPWSDILGATGATYDAPGPINVITYFRRLAIATVNSTSCSAPSNFLTVFVNTVTPPVVAGDQTFCGSGNPVAFTVTTAATYNGTPSYQWQSSIVDCTTGWGNIPGAFGATYDAPLVTQTTYYRVIVTSTLNSIPCSAISNCITVTSYGKTWNGLVSTDWNTAANWTPNGVPTAINCVTVPNTTIKPYILGTNYAAYCYSLTILNGGTLEVIPTNSITVSDVINVNTGGTFNIKNNASLVQINNVANIGNINMERTTQPMYRYDYTYWGSPLTLGSNFTLGGISPNTQPDKYYSWNPTTAGGNGNWIQNSAATVMNPNRGYIIRAPQTYSTDPFTTQAYTANFIGVPNNGNILAPIAVGTNVTPGFVSDKMNLLGNPYPSAVDADLFLNNATNAGLMEGTIYFWTHHSPPSAAYVNPFYGVFTYNYTAGDYATYTSLGGTNTVPAGYGGPTPNGYIAAGQAFFVIGKANGNAIFNNAMRDQGNNGAFFRTTNTQSDKQRVWLNLANTQGGFSQTMVGYTEDATTGYDRNYDGSSFSGNFVSFYSVQSDGRTLTIQGRPSFDQNDTVDLGFHATVANSYVIGIDHFDDPFEAQNIYLEDKLLNVIHDLKQSPYSFTSEIGTFNTRFVLRYTNTTLGVHNPEATVGLTAIIVNEKIIVQASQNIKTIQVFDITGKRIKVYEPSVMAKKFESDFIYAEGVYIAKIKLEDGSVITHKLVNSN